MSVTETNIDSKTVIKTTTKKDTTSQTKKIEIKNYAVILVGGKQYIVHEGKILKVDRLINSNVGDIIELQILRVIQDDKSIENETTKVLAKVLEHKRDPKIIVFKKKRRKNYERTYGHKQHVTYLKIEKIQLK